MILTCTALEQKHESGNKNSELDFSLSLFSCNSSCSHGSYFQLTSMEIRLYISTVSSSVPSSKRCLDERPKAGAQWSLDGPVSGDILVCLVYLLKCLVLACFEEGAEAPQL